jgi:YegS/Rv2252/BmrU family lipid kinase
MARKILYFINPVSGPKRKPQLKDYLVQRSIELEIPYEIYYTNAAGEYPDLPDKIKREEITDVVICGGDGTINQIASYLIGSEVNVGIIPTGSGNGLALAAKIPRKIEKAFDLILKGNAAFIDAFFINEKFGCMLSGIGFDAKVAHDFALQPTRGLATYIQQSVKNFFKAQPYLFDITNAGVTFSSEAYFISIANSNQFGNNFTIAPKASLQDGLLDVIVVKKMSKIKMIWTILKQIRSGEVGTQKDRNFHKNDILYFQTDKLIIQNPELAPLHIDGDPAETAKKFEIEILPKAFKLILP